MNKIVNLFIHTGFGCLVSPAFWEAGVSVRALELGRGLMVRVVVRVAVRERVRLRATETPSD